MGGIMESIRVMVKGIVRYEDQFLLVQRWYDDRIADPYQWEFIDGKLEQGEGPDAAVLRLIQENAGLNTVIEKILYTWQFMSGDVNNIGIAYECMASSDEVILSEELPGYRWVTKEELPEYITNQLILDDLDRVEL